MKLTQNLSHLSLQAAQLSIKSGVQNLKDIGRFHLPQAILIGIGIALMAYYLGAQMALKILVECTIELSLFFLAQKYLLKEISSG